MLTNAFNARVMYRKTYFVPKEAASTPPLLESYLERKTNNYVQSKVESLVSPQEILLATIKRWKLTWCDHVTRLDSLCKTIMQGTVEEGHR